MGAVDLCLHLQVLKLPPTTRVMHIRLTGSSKIACVSSSLYSIVILYGCYGYSRLGGYSHSSMVKLLQYSMGH